MLKNLNLFGEPVFKAADTGASNNQVDASASSSGQRQQDKEAAKSSSSAWELNLGPLSLGSKGIDLKPQLKLGVETSNFNAEIGVSDVRDGLKLAAKVEASVDAVTEGSSMHELHENIHCDTPGFREALKVAKALLGKGSNVLVKIAEIVGITEESLMHIFEGKQADGSEQANKDRLHLVVNASIGVGASAQLCLGWSNTQGYHMVGVGGEVAQGYALGGNVFAGKHRSGTSSKIILGIANFTFNYTVPLQVKEVLPPPIDGSASVHHQNASGKEDNKHASEAPSLMD